MIKYSVQNHTHSTTMHRFHQLDKQCITCLQINPVTGSLLVFSRGYIVCIRFKKSITAICHNSSKMWVNIIIILNIILMVGGRNKQWIKVYHLYPKFFQIVQLIHNPLQVPAIKPVDILDRGRAAPILYFLTWLSYVYIFPVLHIICSITIIKAVHEYLIYDSTLGPVRRRKPRNNSKII